MQLLLRGVRLLLVHGLLEALAEQQPQLVVQTRSPLVERDSSIGELSSGIRPSRAASRTSAESER